MLIVIKSDSRDNENNRGTRSLLNTVSTDYVQFWSNLLSLNDFKELNSIGVHVTEKRRLVCVIYDEILESCIRIMRKLDLNAVKIDQEGEDLAEAANQQQALNTSLSQIDISVSSNPIAGLRPSRPKDLEILINLVDFCRYVCLIEFNKAVLVK